MAGQAHVIGLKVTAYVNDDGVTIPKPIFCAFCDTEIARGLPCATRNIYHEAGNYNRNNGAAVGHNPGGRQDMHLHLQCAWQVEKVNSRGAMCVMCTTPVAQGTLCFTTDLGRPGARCTLSASGHEWQCVDCLTNFIAANRDLLDGHVGRRSQFDTPVAWITHVFGGASSLPYTHSHIPDPALRARMHAAFATSDAAEAQAVAHHQELQRVIKAALAEDARKKARR